MSRSYKVPFYKAKSRWYQLYHNRRERRMAKEALASGDYTLPEKRITSGASWAVIDQVANPFRHPGKWTEKAGRK